jgi:hypothetical protein
MYAGFARDQTVAIAGFAGIQLEGVDRLDEAIHAAWTAGGGNVSVGVVRPDEVAYRLGQAVRSTVDPKGDTTYVATMAGTGAIVGDFLTGGTAWGAGVGFVAGWVAGVNQLRRR